MTKKVCSGRANKYTETGSAFVSILTRVMAVSSPHWLGSYLTILFNWPVRISTQQMKEESVMAKIKQCLSLSGKSGQWATRGSGSQAGSHVGG